MDEYEPNKPGSSQDWTVEQMLLETVKYVKQEEEKNPTGLKGAVVMLYSTDDRILQLKALGDSPHLYFCSGITDQEIMALCGVVQHNLIYSMIHDAIDKRLGGG